MKAGEIEKEENVSVGEDELIEFMLFDLTDEEE